MTVHGGLFGAIDGISSVRNWSVSEMLANPSYIASNTRAGTARKSGVQSWSGNFGFFGRIPPVMPGEFFTFTGYTAPSDDARGSNGNTLEGSAIVDSVVINFNFATGEIISQQLNFSGHLGLTWSTNQTAILDETAIDAAAICGCHIDYSSNGTDFSVLSDITQGTLTISAKNTSYVNSTTNCTTGRLRGPIDWTATINRQCDTKQLTIGNDYSWRWYTDVTYFWLLKWGKIKDFSNLNVSIESNEPISHTVNLEMNGYNNAIGSIRRPEDVADWWPAAT